MESINKTKFNDDTRIHNELRRWTSGASRGIDDHQNCPKVSKWSFLILPIVNSGVLYSILYAPGTRKLFKTTKQHKEHFQNVDSSTSWYFCLLAFVFVMCANSLLFKLCASILTSRNYLKMLNPLDSHIEGNPTRPISIIFRRACF